MSVPKKKERGETFLKKMTRTPKVVMKEVTRRKRWEENLHSRRMLTGI